jgi:hypothetical protein
MWPNRDPPRQPLLAQEGWPGAVAAVCQRATAPEQGARSVARNPTASLLVIALSYGQNSELLLSAARSCPAP